MLTFAKALAGEHLEYFLDWLAYHIQTGEKTKVALVVLGAPGCGKSTFLISWWIRSMAVFLQLDWLRLMLEVNNWRGSTSTSRSSVLLGIDEPTKFSVSLQQEFKNYITGDTQEV